MATRAPSAGTGRASSSFSGHCAISRRGLLGSAIVGATLVTPIAVTACAVAGGDPALAATAALKAHRDAYDWRWEGTPAEDAWSARYDELEERVVTVEATTPRGLAAKLGMLELYGTDARLVDNVIAQLERMS